MRGGRKKMISKKQVELFQGLFTGLTSVYGTYDPATGRASQVKAPVTDKVVYDHLLGQQPYGVYLLMQNRTRAAAVDFDTENRMRPMEFVSQAKHYGITSYIERSKSKGYHHVWVFFNGQGVLAYKARAVVRHILDEIEASDTELFPKQDALNSNICFGNFINAPLFGLLVPKGKTVFVDPGTFNPYPDQWDFLKNVHKMNESVLDDIIEINDIFPAPGWQFPDSASKKSTSKQHNLPLCAQKMLRDGVTQYQRVSCFRLAVHFKRMGFKLDAAIETLKNWAQKNRPSEGRRIISDREIIDQTSYAFNRAYRGYGCDSEAVAPFCHLDCPVNKPKIMQIEHNS